MELVLMYLQYLFCCCYERNSGFSVNPCNVKFTNAHKMNPARQGGTCIKFTGASEGDIFVVFASIPSDHNTWYHVQITPSGVALYKVSELRYFIVGYSY